MVAGAAAGARVQMVQVVPAKAVGSGAITVRVGPASVEVREGFNGQLLRSVVEALAGVS